jgi:hypothetical protein
MALQIISLHILANILASMECHFTILDILTHSKEDTLLRRDHRLVLVVKSKHV